MNTSLVVDVMILAKVRGTSNVLLFYLKKKSFQQKRREGTAYISFLMVLHSFKGYGLNIANDPHTRVFPLDILGDGAQQMGRGHSYVALY